MSTTQEERVIEVLRQNNGYATLRRLYEALDFTEWKTKTPEASVRRIVQNSAQIFKIQPGLWALEEARDAVMRLFDIKEDDRSSEERFSHGYYQGLLVEIGKYKGQTTFVPSQDKGRMFIDKPLGEVSDLTDLPPFTSYEHILRKAKTVDVIWFNKARRMPTVFFEVEHTTDIKNSLSKFYELQDFYAKFFIVADQSRERDFRDKVSQSIYSAIEKRVQFLSYDKVAGTYTAMEKEKEFQW